MGLQPDTLPNGSSLLLTILHHFVVLRIRPRMETSKCPCNLIWQYCTNSHGLMLLSTNGLQTKSPRPYTGLRGLYWCLVLEYVQYHIGSESGRERARREITSWTRMSACYTLMQAWGWVRLASRYALLTVEPHEYYGDKQHRMIAKWDSKRKVLLMTDCTAR